MRFRSLWDPDVALGVAHVGLWPKVEFIIIIDLIRCSWTRMTQHMYVLTEPREYSLSELKSFVVCGMITFRGQLG